MKYIEMDGEINYMSFSCEKIRKARKEHKCEYGAIIQKGQKKMITYTPPKVEILTNRSWGSTPESNMKSIIQALEVCRDSHIAEEDYQKVIRKYCFPNQRFDKAGNPMPPHLRLLEFTNLELFNEDSLNWYDIDIPEFTDEWGGCNLTCSARSCFKDGSSNVYNSLFVLERCKHVDLPMTHSAKRIMIRIECSSKVGHHLRTHRGVSWCAQANSSLPLTKGFSVCHSKPEWFERNLPAFKVMFKDFLVIEAPERSLGIPKKERIANQLLPTDWLMRPRVGVASRRQWLEMCEQRILDPKTHPETKYVVQMIKDNLEAMGEDG